MLQGCALLEAARAISAPALRSAHQIMSQLALEGHEPDDREAAPEGSQVELANVVRTGRPGSLSPFRFLAT
jgi:hypothetical protein